MVNKDCYKSKNVSNTWFKGNNLNCLVTNTFNFFKRWVKKLAESLNLMIYKATKKEKVENRVCPRFCNVFSLNLM